MAKKVILEKHKDVARIDQEDKRTHGWYVRVRFQGTTHSKFFSDGKCGGRSQACSQPLPGETPWKKRLARFVPTSILLQ